MCSQFKKFFCIVLVTTLLGGGVLSGQEDTDPIREAPGSPGKLSLELKGMDVLDVLRLLSVKSGLNIVAGANVRGRVTLFLKEVDPWDAFVIILETNNLAYEVKGGIIKVMTDRDYEQLYGGKFQDKTTVQLIRVRHANVDQLTSTLSEIKTRIGKIIPDARSGTLVLIDIPERVDQMTDMITRMDVPTETRVFTLNYAKTEEVVPELEKVLTEDVGRIESDVRTNKIAVTDMPERLRIIEQLIGEFDEKTPEVLIIAKIIEITLSDDYAFGIDWTIFTRIFQNASSPLLTADLNVDAIGTSGVATLNFARGDLTTVVEALKTFGQTNTLSSPRLLVANNEEAKILVGTDEAFVTQQTVVSAGGSNTSDEVQFVEVGTKLSVTPTINRDGFVTLRIKPEVSSVSDTLIVGANDTSNAVTAEQTARTAVPIISTSEAETTVLVKDGHTILIGGLIKDKENVDIQEVPFLGGLPLIGGLFRAEDREIDKTELVIFVTPHIVTGEEDIFKVEELDMSLEEQARLAASSEWFAPPGAGTEKGPAGFAPRASLEERAADPASYEALLRGRILASLSQLLPQAKRVGEVQLSFRLSPDGQLVKEPVILSRRNELLDPIVLKSVRDSAPFPPFPGGFEDESKIFNLAIAFE